MEGYEVDSSTRALSASKRILLAVLQTLHFSILLFVLLGWASPLPEVRIVHLLLVPGLILHWKTNNDICVLTSIEARIRGEQLREEGGFIRSIVERISSREIPESTLRAGVYICMACAWSASALRLLG